MGCGFGDSCADCSLGGVFDCDGCDSDDYRDYDPYDYEDDWDGHDEDSYENEADEDPEENAGRRISYCSACGASINSRWNYCIYCGTARQEKQPLQQYCTKCGKAMLYNWDYCPYCGSRIPVLEENIARPSVDVSSFDGKYYEEDIPF